MRISPWWIPAAVVLAAALGLGAGRFAVVPSYTRDFGTPSASGNALRTTVLVVDGLKCVDTAERVGNQLVDVPGVRSFVAFASRNRAEISFDPALTGPQALVKAIEGPVYDEATGEITFHEYRVVEVDGVEVHEPALP